MIDLLIVSLIVLAIVFIAVSIIRWAVRFLLKLGIFALIIFLILQVIHVIK
jgi:hypothetical protein